MINPFKKDQKLSVFHTEREDGKGVITIRASDPTRYATITHEHENYDEIVRLANNDDERVFELFSPTEMLNRLTALSDRISYQNGRLYVDGDEAEGAIVEHILRLVKEKDPNIEATVKFYENILMNPDQHSREQAWGWLDSHDFTITTDGYIVGYKGVHGDSAEGYHSREAGTAWVNGEKIEGQIPYKTGDRITMPRSEVTHDPAVGCSIGLHVGTWKYAQNFKHNQVMEVHVHPRDIVSVPTDCNEEKMRVCAMDLKGFVTSPHTAPVI